MTYHTTLLMSELVTHDMDRFVVVRPDRFDFEPGQGIELATDEPDWSDKRRPTTPTSLRDDRVLEFTIQAYPDHHRATERLYRAPGTALTMTDAFGTRRYAGPEVFIAAGAGAAANIRDFEQYLYVCGPPKFTEAVNAALQELGADSQALIFER